MKRQANTYLFDLCSKATGHHFSMPVTAYSEELAHAALAVYYADNFDICDKAKEIAEPHKYYAELNTI